MANDKGITTGTETKAGITTGSEETGSKATGITTGSEAASSKATGITTGSEATGIATRSAGANLMPRSGGDGNLRMVSGMAKSGGYELADCGIPAENILALIQPWSGAWAGFVLQDSEWKSVFQTRDWRTVLDYASSNDLLIKQAYPHPATLSMSRAYPTIPASNWG